MGKDYDTEKIWERVNASIDLRKLKDAKNDKERFKIFKKALAKDPTAKNLTTPRAFLRKNLKKLYNRALAQEVAKGNKGVQQSLKRFSEPRRKQVIRFSREQKIDTAQDRVIAKAEGKGFKVREVPKVKIDSLKPKQSIKKIIRGDVTLSRYKLKGRNVIAIYQKGKRGPITLEYL